MSMTATLDAISQAEKIEELSRIILAYSDVTERLQASHEKLQQTVASLRGELSEKNRLLERRKRLAALGEMAAGLAHEIRNPLGGIQLYASILARDVEDRPAALDTVRKIAIGVRRLEALVSQVLCFTRDLPVNICEFDLREVLDQTVELAAQRLTSTNVSCQMTGEQSLRVAADPLLMGQALLNLVLNAADAMETTGGHITLHMERAEAPRQFRLLIRDTGAGIPPANLDQIFNPFFTTKDSGTGLGLAIVHRIVESHDGTISASNHPEGGACFEILI